ncbi:magnesium transporter [Hyphomicrobium sulfonivorans]|uniref:magnesium transporter n=1 Tax=Hyphomicrobium sulfonivorans TaxID=121290 RepID=UPI00156D490F|nr:magnesium transporter [Hyphomicrobium sulfonivorans]MBI1650150.1 magnesium transporter [Hyphomicrobium sulfonivorans]NSL73067.1 magnesium transporter [Hyphomicrobium sulfonivorans]
MTNADETVAPERGNTPIAECISTISEALERHDLAKVREVAAGLENPDLADVIEELAPEQRVELIEALGADFDFEVLTEVDEKVRDQISEALPNDVLAKAVTELDSDDAAYLLESLEADDRQEILDQLPQSDRAALERNLLYPGETAGRLMQADFVAVPPFWTVGQVIDFARDTEDLPETFSEIFVVDPGFHLLGSVNISRLLRTKRDVPINTIMEADRHMILATADQEQVARQFERYGLMAVPVVDSDERLVGVVTVDDVVEVIEQEADEDAKLLAGVGDERLSDSVREIAPPRFLWLLVNVLFAMVSASIIDLFGGSIEQMVALAVLMPIIASMGGNAGTQTMTVTVRALATKELSDMNVRRVALREVTVALINGVLFACLLSALAIFWFGGAGLGVVIAIAIMINLLVAAVAGMLIPLGLQRLGFDPAVASTVFVTSLTDVVGFFAFLGLATFWLL